MTILVLATDIQWEEMQLLVNDQWHRVVDEAAFFAGKADIYINLLEDSIKKDYSKMPEPVLVNATCTTLHSMQAPSHVGRLNGWPGFLNRSTWELAVSTASLFENFFRENKITPLYVADEPGLVSAKVIAMIVNEAYFALAEGVSTKAEIDIAMKLGTNYPFGPFEWSEKIGVHNIASLLLKLSETDSRYTACPLLLKESNL
ncbi:MAG: 3-hydroxyacyl-CoA dehydrogenase family protein [Chitinophagaceae bacterium]